MQLCQGSRDDGCHLRGYSWRSIEKKTSLSTWCSSTWRRLSILSRTSSYGMPYDRIMSLRPTSDGSNSFIEASPAWSGAWLERCRHSLLTTECSEDLIPPFVYPLHGQLHYTERWPVTAKHEQALHVMKMQMLRWNLWLT